MRDLRIDIADRDLAVWVAGQGGMLGRGHGLNPAPAACQTERIAGVRRLWRLLCSIGLRAHTGENVADAGDWPVEESCFVVGMGSDEAKELARKFGQNAVVCGGQDGAPRLIWVDEDQQDPEGKVWENMAKVGRFELRRNWGGNAQSVVHLGIRPAVAAGR